ncbi:MAG: thiamine-monophosphate kinase [Verrucomicrobia bacterium]|nr:thiamine-monophosphate kinase [Verrucomicrobiota bacterium]
MNELDLIRLLTQNLPTHPAVVVGPGDDCAVLDLGLPDHWLLFKTDAIVEDTHFTRDTPPEDVGHKALARPLSDIAAMAGTPTAALVTAALPATFDPRRVCAVYNGITRLAQRCHVAIAGGETTRTPDRILLSVSVLGTVPRRRCPLRSAAQPGDAIFVSGDLGGSLAGKHLRFEPRLSEARWLAEHFPIHAMIDLSDGIATDLPHVLDASHVGAELLKSAIPVSRAARTRARTRQSPKAALLAALTDGEDFELLFTLPPRHAVSLFDRWTRQFPGLRLSCIGKITAQPGLTLRDASGLQPLAAHGYVHFDKP